MSKESLAKQHIKTLFQEAREAYSQNPDRSHRYVMIARKIANKARISIPYPQSREYCKKCLHFLLVGKNLRKRTYKGKIIYTCIDCKQISRIPITTAQ